MRHVAPIGSVSHYIVIQNFGVGGATVKDVLQDPDTGDVYIAKLGTRNNDIEVLTEMAIFLIGRSLGVSTADAKIAEFRGSQRFLSKYFLRVDRQEELVHGMQLFKELYDDNTVICVLGDELREQAMFSVQSVESAFGAHYLHYGADAVDRLFDGFVTMLVHDALIGVQDRHHENWGVVVQRSLDAPAPRFAPLYDSARGLFCNETDPALAKKYAGRAGSQRLDGFVSRSRPLVGFGGLEPFEEGSTSPTINWSQRCFARIPASVNGLRTSWRRTTGVPFGTHSRPTWVDGLAQRASSSF